MGKGERRGGRARARRRRQNRARARRRRHQHHRRRHHGHVTHIRSGRGRRRHARWTFGIGFLKSRRNVSNTNASAEPTTDTSQQGTSSDPLKISALIFVFSILLYIIGGTVLGTGVPYNQGQIIAGSVLLALATVGMVVYYVMRFYCMEITEEDIDAETGNVSGNTTDNQGSVFTIDLEPTGSGMPTNSGWQYTTTIDETGRRTTTVTTIDSSAGVPAANAFTMMFGNVHQNRGTHAEIHEITSDSEGDPTATAACWYSHQPPPYPTGEVMKDDIDDADIPPPPTYDEVMSNSNNATFPSDAPTS
ncbi:uncharacterized protein [Ptychodera flava]|uniref:uncharacterized protein isoform X2 n=1 Tax=Ptychodera flava TaxID=63121 RepID=UPI00396A0E77